MDRSRIYDRLFLRVERNKVVGKLAGMEMSREKDMSKKVLQKGYLVRDRETAFACAYVRVRVYD